MYKGGINEGCYIKLTDQEEYVLMMGKKTDNPVIISLHGGPGAPTTFRFTADPARRQHFWIIVFWIT